MGPPVVTRRWSAAQVKEGVADESVHRLGDVVPLERSAAGARVVQQLEALGWQQQVAEGGFAAGQPQYTFVVPLVDDDGVRRTEDEVLAGMNQLWRRNIKKAAKAGVTVSVSTTATSGVPSGRPGDGRSTARPAESSSQQVSSTPGISARASRTSAWATAWSSTSSR